MVVVIKNPFREPLVQRLVGAERLSRLIRFAIGHSVGIVDFGDDIVMLIDAGGRENGKERNFQIGDGLDVYGPVIFLGKKDESFIGLSETQHNMIQSCFPKGMFRQTASASDDNDDDAEARKETLARISDAYIKQRVKEAIPEHIIDSTVEIADVDIKEKADTTVRLTWGEAPDADDIDKVLAAFAAAGDRASKKREGSDLEEVADVPVIPEDTENINDQNGAHSDKTDDISTNADYQGISMPDEPALPDADAEIVTGDTDVTDDAAGGEGDSALSFEHFTDIVLKGRSMLAEFLSETAAATVSEEVGRNLSIILLERYMSSIVDDTALFLDIKVFVEAEHTNSEKEGFCHDLTSKLVGLGDVKAEYNRRFQI